MTNENLEQQVLNKIQTQEIKPKPKWQFLLKEYVVWVFFGACVLVGATAVSVVIYMLTNNDWDIYKQLGGSAVDFILTTLPYFWLILLALFVLLADYNLKHTKKGYRFGLKTVLGVVVGVSLVLGVLFYNIGLGQAIESRLSSRMPLYQKLMQHRLRVWQQPGRGFLFGTVKTPIENGFFSLRDLENKEWQVMVPEGEEEFLLEGGSQLKLRGIVIDEGVFRLMEIRPCLPMGPAIFNKQRPMVNGWQMRVK